MNNVLLITPEAVLGKSGDDLNFQFCEYTVVRNDVANSSHQPSYPNYCVHVYERNMEIVVLGRLGRRPWLGVIYVLDLKLRENSLICQSVTLLVPIL